MFLTNIDGRIGNKMKKGKHFFMLKNAILLSGNVLMIKKIIMFMVDATILY